MTNEERIEKLAATILNNKAQIEELEEANRNMRATMAELCDEGDNYVGEFKINVRENRRFDAAVASKNLTVDELALISVPKPDSTLAKKLLPADRLAAAQKNFGNVVTVGLRND